jgi:hypothetical protein
MAGWQEAPDRLSGIECDKVASRHPMGAVSVSYVSGGVGRVIHSLQIPAFLPEARLAQGHLLGKTASRKNFCAIICDAEHWTFGHANLRSDSGIQRSFLHRPRG